MNQWMSECIHACIHAFTHSMNERMDKWINEWVNALMHAWMHACATVSRTRTHARTHTHTHTHTPSQHTLQKVLCCCRRWCWACAKGDRESNRGQRRLPAVVVAMGLTMAGAVAVVLLVAAAAAAAAAETGIQPLRKSAGNIYVNGGTHVTRTRMEPEHKYGANTNGMRAHVCREQKCCGTTSARAKCGW